ncbi:MAG TPA: vWA domain-containing protein [Kofleriaceae bacterium]|nr:vWA domain-containing protein [Kofleriaceae bacterium]
MRTRLVLLAPLLAGCPDRTISGVPVEQGTVETKDIPSVPRRDLDVLFVIDSSGSMREEQESLKANFPRFVSVLESIDGGLPNVHLGVITPDLGTQALDGSAPAIGGCSGSGGNRGALHGIAGGPLFLSDADDGAGGRSRNYTGTLAERFSELADVGDMGCGIEQHLESMKVALDNNPANAGFLREDALLAVVLIADEDDCSLAQKALFDGNTSDSTWGDRVNFRCTREGVACDTPGTSLDQPGLREDCHPNYDSTMLTQTDRYATFLKGLKTDPRDVIVAGIVGDAGPFEIQAKTVGAQTYSVLKPSCTYNGASGAQFAYPAIRMLDFMSQFPGHATSTTICDADLSDALTQVAAQIVPELGSPCFDSPLADVDPFTAGPQYECTVTEYRRTGTADEELRVFPQCTSGRTPCWKVEEDAAQCFFTDTDPHLKLVLDLGGEAAQATTRLKVNCVTTTDSGEVM